MARKAHLDLYRIERYLDVEVLAISDDGKTFGFCYGFSTSNPKPESGKAWTAFLDRMQELEMLGYQFKGIVSFDKKYFG